MSEFNTIEEHSNNIRTHTYGKNLRIRSLLGNGGPGGPPCDKCGGGGGGDGGGDGTFPVEHIIMIIISVIIFLSCFCLGTGIYFDIRDRAAQVQVRIERVHCSNTEDVQEEQEQEELGPASV